jgi:hypothetical protein
MNRATLFSMIANWNDDLEAPPRQGSLASKADLHQLGGDPTLWKLCGIKLAVANKIGAFETCFHLAES